MAGMKLKSGDLVLDTVLRVLRRGEFEIMLEPKVFDCIAVLMAAAGELTSLEQLRAALWPEVRVGDGALRRIINEARKALGDRGEAQDVIRTRKGLGYVFVPAVELQESDAAPTAV